MPKVLVHVATWPREDPEPKTIEPERVPQKEELIDLWGDVCRVKEVLLTPASPSYAATLWVTSLSTPRSYPEPTYHSVTVK